MQTIHDQRKKLATQLALKSFIKPTYNQFKLGHTFSNNNDIRNYIYDITGTLKLPSSQPIIKLQLNNLKIISKLTVLNVASCGILNQGALGSCGPNSLVVACSLASNGRITNMSRLYTYFITECLDNNNPLTDNGVTSQNLVKSLIKYSYCDESLMPYILTNYLTLPPLTCFKNTHNLTNIVYSYINQDINMLANLQNNILNTFNKVQLSGIIIGILVYSSFPMNSTNGIIPVPNPRTERLLGGHAVSLVGFKTINGQNYITFQNSWGTTWGDKGYGYLPMAYLQNASLCEKPTVITFNMIN